MLDTLGRNNRKIADKHCVQCGGQFRPRRDTAAYCSVPCARSKNGGHNLKSETWWINQSGYREGRVLTAQGHRRVKFHRFVMECQIGRLLRPDEDVHHIDGDRLNNDLQNLELLTHGEHTSKHCASRVYRRGYRLELSDAERARRSTWMAEFRARAAIAKATQSARQHRGDVE